MLAIYKTDPEKAGPHAQVLLDYISQAGREFVKRFQGFNALVQNDANAQSYRSQAAIYSAQSNNAMNMSFMYQQEGRQGADMYAMERATSRGGQTDSWSGGMGCGPMGLWDTTAWDTTACLLIVNPLMYQNRGAWPGAVGAAGLPFTPGVIASVMPGVVPTPRYRQRQPHPRARRRRTSSSPIARLLSSAAQEARFHTGQHSVGLFRHALSP